ncbi:MAG: OadG family protein [Bacteroidales bacterium]|jgi:Na+-transporting methylmalonyl-CoA/oxaloacetate decarboxylase gamma subunit|nr:OadG family protein [Bacteroidales bacterium]
MKRKIRKFTFLLLCFVISFGLNAQNGEINKVQPQAEAASYDPLIPQMFAVDSKTQTVAVINKNENTIEILSPKGNTYEKKKVLLVDKTERRHDVQAIYTPQSVAIYENHVVYLASNRDSSFVRVLSLEGEQIDDFHFNGAASAFSYDIVTKMLYIAGDNTTGYNVFAIDVKNGFENINISDAPLFNYTKPRKADEIKKHDPWGVGLTAIAVSTVFLALLVIVLIMKGETDIIKRSQNLKSKGESVQKKVSHTNKVSDFSGEEFAAIAAAVYMYNEDLHDEENVVLTINKVAKAYSSWSSKMHNINVYKR